VVSFSTRQKVFPKIKGESLLRSLDRFRNGGFFMNNSTDTRNAVANHYRYHDRLIVLTDEQANNYWSEGAVYSSVPDDKMVITFNLAGYKHAHAPAGTKTRVTIGGLSDAAFQLIPALEGRTRSEWPF